MIAPREASAPLETDVLVVGGGLAGLTCAVGLRGSGLKVTVLEGGELLGGRARSWTCPTTGDPVTIGPHIFLSRYDNMLRLLDLCGTRHRVVWHDQEFITLVEGRQRLRFRMSRLPAPMHFLPSWLSEPRIGPLDVLSNMRATLLALRLDEEDILRLDELNALGFLRSLGVSQTTIERFWAFTTLAILNVPLELCSAGALMRFYRYLISLDGYCVGFADGGLGDLFGPAAQRLIADDGGEVLTRTRAAAFTGSARRATGVVLEDGRRIEARFCVAALPPQDLRRLLPREWARAHPAFGDLASFQPCPYVSIQVWLDRKLTRERFWARVHRPGDLNCDFYDLSNIYSGWSDRPSVIASNIIYSHRVGDMTQEEIVEETIHELAEAFPEAARARVEHAVVNRIPMAIHCPFPGTERRRPEQRSPVRGLLLAGDWVKTGLPSSMEGACCAGWRAAEAVLADVGRPRSLAAPPLAPAPIPALIHRAGRLLPRVPRYLRGARSA